MSESKDKKYFRFSIFFVSTGALRLHNVTEDGLAEWNQKLVEGVPFIRDVGKTPWYFNPEHIVHTEVHVQRIGEFSDDPRGMYA